MRMKIDVAVLARETHGEPFLALAAKFAVKGYSQQMRRQIIGHPVWHFGNYPGLVGARFFFQFAQCRLARLFALVNATLRHLPAFEGLINALTDENQALVVQEHYAHSGPVWKRRRHMLS